MVVFVNSEYFVRAFEVFRQQAKEISSECSVHVIATTGSADTVASWCLLHSLLSMDHIPFELHPVTTQDDIECVLKDHACFSRDETMPVQVLFLNCGAQMSLPDLIDVHRCSVHIMDYHGPVHMNNLLSSSPTLYVWDHGTLQEDIEKYFSQVLGAAVKGSFSQAKRQKRTQLRRRQGAGAADEDSQEYEDIDDVDGGDDDDDLDNYTLDTDTTQQTFSWDRLTSLSPEDVDRYHAECAHQRVTPSKFLFEITKSLRPQLEDTALWFYAIALTEHMLNNTLPSQHYGAEMFKIQDLVNVSSLVKAKTRRIALRDSTNAQPQGLGGDRQTEEFTSIGTYHSVQLEITEDYKLTLLTHWSLSDALQHSSYTAFKLGTVKGDSSGRQKLQDLLAHLGVTVKESQTKWTELPLTRRSEILKLLCTEEGGNKYGFHKLRFPSIARRGGYGVWCSASDVIHILNALFATASCSKDTFHRAVTLVERGVSNPFIHQTLEYYRSVLLQATALLQKNVITTLKSFHYVFLNEEDVPSRFLNANGLRCLASFLLPSVAARHAKKSGAINKQRLIVGALDSSRDEFIVIGATNNRWSSALSLEPHFTNLSKMHSSIVRHTGVDRDYVMVRANQCVNIIEALHVYMVLEGQTRR